MLVVIDTGVLYIVIFWTSVFLINFCLKTSRRLGFRYTELLISNGLTLSFCQIRWQTAILNKFFSKLGRSRPQLSLLWFNAGVLFAVISMVMSLVLLSTMVYQSVASNTKSDKVLQPVMPGLNLPWNQVWYYLLTLIVSGAFHEVGHAIAAVRENVRVLSFGVFLLFLYPGAFVELHTDQLDIITPVRRLRIYSAGVWHNFVLALIAYLLTFSLPVLLVPFFEIDNGVLVTWISSELSISSRLPSGDVITKLNRCPVRTKQDWYECLRNIERELPDGYCTSLNFMKTHNSSLSQLTVNYGEMDCCNDTSAYRFCFWYHRKTKSPSFVQRMLSTNIFIRISAEYNSAFTEHTCLPARHIISAPTLCHINQDCTSGQQQHQQNSGKQICLKPLVKNTSRVIQIEHRKGQDVLFVGDPRELLSTIMFSNYVPKWNIPFLRIADHLQALLLYMISISSALAVLNMVPCLYLDGHHTLSILLDIFFPRHPRVRLKLKNGVLFLGTSLLLINIVIAIFSLATS